MKCALCGREIKGRDYIRVSTPDQKGIYVHSAPCEWYAGEGNMNDDTIVDCTPKSGQSVKKHF